MNFDYQYAIGDPWPDAFLRNLVPALWQGGLLILLALAICRLFSRLSLNSRRLLWLLVCLKMAMAPFWITPVTLLPATTPPLPILGNQASPLPPAGIAVQTDSNMANKGGTKSARSTKPIHERAASGTTGGTMVRTEVSGFRASPLPLPHPEPLYRTTLLWSLWLTGLGWHLYRALRRLFAVRHLLRTAVALDAPDIAEEARALAERLGLRRLPRLLISPEVTSPLVVGPFWPAVLLPADFAVRFSSEERGMMLAHEMAHLRRYNLWFGLAPLLAQACFWFFPPAACASRQWAIAREAVCDADALNVTGATTAAYGLLLLKVITPLAPRSPLAALGLGAGYRTLKQRLVLLAQARHAARSRLQPLLAACGVALVIPWRLNGPPKSLADVYHPSFGQRARLMTFAAPGVPYRLTDLTLTLHTFLPERSDDLLLSLDDSGRAVGSHSVITSQGGLGRPEIVRVAEDAASKFSLPHDTAVVHVSGLPASGAIVGTLDFDRTRPRAFQIQDGVLRELGSLGGPRSLAYGVNAAGDIVGEADIAPGRSHAFLYREGRFADLGTLGGKKSGAVGINNRGDIVGWSETASGSTLPFLYRDGKMRSLNLHLPGNRKFSLTALNDRGDIIGAVTTYPSGHQQGFLYRNGVTREILAPGIVPSETSLVAINARGQIVGTIQTPNATPRAFLYENGRLRDLTALIPPDSRCTPEYALDINDAGQILVMGNREGARRTFLLTPNP